VAIHLPMIPKPKKATRISVHSSKLLVEMIRGDDIPYKLWKSD
jgi:hypothetical protein